MKDEKSAFPVFRERRFLNFVKMPLNFRQAEKPAAPRLLSSFARR